jgi:hypothetical protein
VRISGNTISYIDQTLRLMASRCQKCRNEKVPFLNCSLRFSDNLYMEGRGKRRRGAGSPFSGCVKSETDKKRPSVKIDGARSHALRGAMGVKNGVKSGRFWQPLSQDVALCCII